MLRSLPFLLGVGLHSSLRAGDVVVLLVMVCALAVLMLYVMFLASRSGRTPGRQLSRRVAAGTIVRTAGRALGRLRGPAEWN